MVSVARVSADVRGPAGVLAGLFERDRQLAIRLNAAQRRLLAANERLTVVMPVGTLMGAGGGDLGLGRPAVLDAKSPTGALQEIAEVIRLALVDYQDVAEQRRMLAADIGEATGRLVDALTAVGFRDAQARGADVWALCDGIYREGLK